MTTDETPATFRGSPATTGEPWLGYIRVSTWKEEKISPELQRESIEQWARHTGRRIVDWVVDLDASGRNFKRKIMGAIERVEGGEARGIAVWRYSRFGRDRTGNAINLARLEAIGGRLESATEPVDATTAIGRFQRGMILEFGAFESDRTGEQWNDVHRHRLDLALPSAGRPRYGYIWHPRRVPDASVPGGWRVQEERYEPDPLTAPTLASLYMQYSNGTGFVALTQQINELGHLTTRGRPWRHDTLLRYMDSGFPAGLLQVRDHCTCPKNRASSCRHWRHFPGAHPPVITYGTDADPEQVWKEYRARRATVAKQPVRTRSATYELSGLVRCALCSGAMSAKPRNKKAGNADWRCARAASGAGCPGAAGSNADLLKVVSEWLLEVAHGVDTAPATAAALPAQTGPDTAEQRARLTGEHSRMQDALTRLITDYAINPDRYPADAYDRARQNIEKERDRVLAQLATLDKERAPVREDFRPLAVGIVEEWPTFSIVQRNLILRQLVRYVRVHPRPSRYVTRAEVVPVWESA